MEFAEALDQLRDRADDTSQHPFDEAAQVIVAYIEDGPAVEDFGEMSAQLDEVTAERDAQRAELERLRLFMDHHADPLMLELERLRSERDALSTLLRGMARRATLLRGVMTHAMTQNDRLRAELEDHRKRQTTGGPTVPVDTEWANVTLPPPESASDPSAPPLRTGRGSERLVPPT
jgi:hypothetical protein